MTQVDFAAALGVAPASVHRWESGTSSPEFEMIVSLWSLAIKSQSGTSTFFAEFLTSKTDAIRPLFEMAELPEIRSLDKDVAGLAVDKRQLVRAFMRMLEGNNDPTADRVMRLLLEPWKFPASGEGTSKKAASSGKHSSQARADQKQK